MKCTLLGNCQTLALTKYIEFLEQDIDVMWVHLEAFQHWNLRCFAHMPIRTCTKDEVSIQRLRESDIIIYQPIKASTSPTFHPDKLKKHAPHAKFISISSLVYDKNDMSMWERMRTRAHRHNIDIPGHIIMKKIADQVVMHQPDHPSALYFFEVMREICKITGWDYYTDEQYRKIWKMKWPYG